jgi:hypothetical protein
LFNGVAFVGGQIVHDDKVSGRQGRPEHLVEVDEESGSIDCAVQHKRRCDGVMPQAGDESRGLPMAEGLSSNQSLMCWATAIGAGNFCIGRCFVDEDELPRIEATLSRNPGSPGFDNVWPQLLGGVQSFF